MEDQTYDESIAKLNMNTLTAWSIDFTGIKKPGYTPTYQQQQHYYKMRKNAK